MKLENIIANTIYHTKNYGDVRVIEDLGRINGKHIINIEFINTGNIKKVELYELKRGNVKDDSIPYKRLAFNSDEIHHSNNYGDFVIIKDLGFLQYGVRYVKIRFIDTNYESIVTYNNARIGNVKDIMRPTVYGVGYIGTEETLKSNSIDKILYHRWINMISRCYNKNDKRYDSYGGIGVHVNNEWLNFNNYRNDVKLIHSYNLFEANPKLYHLDKDYLQLELPHNLRVYSKYTCIWIDSLSNAKLTNDIAVAHGVICNNGLFFTKVYDYNSCSLIDYGPFDSIENALSVFNMYPIYNFLQNHHYCYNIGLKNMCTIINNKV